MISLSHMSFALFGIISIICLSIGGYIVKRYFRFFPNKLIPLLNILVSLIVTCVWSITRSHNHSFWFCIQMGITYGLASVGLHQVIKQTIDYFKIRKYLRNKYNKQSHIISMSD